MMSEAIRDLMSAEFSSVDAYQILEDNSKTPHTCNFNFLNNKCTRFITNTVLIEII